MINFCWFCVKWGLVPGAIGAAAVAFYFYDRVDEEIRCRVVERIAEHYRGLKVTARSADLAEEGIEVRGLSILQPGAEGPCAELVYFDEILLDCTTDLQELIRGEFEVRHVTIRRPRLRATRQPDGTWSTSRLLPLPKLSEHPPAVTIQSGTIEIFDPLKNPASTLTLRDVNLTLAAPDPSSPKPDSRTLKGTLSADHLRHVQVEGQLDPRGGSWTIRGAVDGLDVSPELRGALPGPLAAKLAMLADLRGHGSLGFRLSYDPAAPAPYLFDLYGRLAQGRVDDPRLPSPLTDISATIRASNHPTAPGFAIEQLEASLGQAKLHGMSIRQAGFDRTSPRWVEAKIEDLEIDRNLAESLPAPLLDHWDKYRPTGRVDVDELKLYFDGQKWHPQRVKVQCENVSFTHHNFNYRLHNGHGPVTLENDFLDLHLIAYSGSREVRVDAEMQQVSSRPFGLFRAEGNGLQLDAKVLDALKPKQRGVVRSLNPHGAVNFRVRRWRDGPDEPWHKYLQIDLIGCSMRYEHFQYPLNHLHGTIVMQDDHWSFRGLRGRNEKGWVTCEEGYLTSPDQGQQLFLRLVGANIQLEPELRDALRPNHRRLWDNLQPKGTVNLVVDVRYQVPTKQRSVALRAEPQGDTTSLKPVHFPYDLRKLRGVLFYRDGHVTLHGLRAEHGSVKIAAGGYCSFLADGSWDFQLQGLTVDRLRLEDRELIQALPGRLKKAIVELKPTGPVSLRGSFGLEGGAQVGDPVRSRWDLAIGFCQGSIDCGVKLENLNGNLTLKGGFNGQNFHSRGELDIDSLNYQDYQFTQVRGPVWIDDQQALFGSWVGRQRNQRAAANTRQQPRPLVAKLFGGTVTCDPWIVFGQQPRYGLHATLSRADLSCWAQEAMMGRQDLRGKVYATVNLGGTGRSLNALVGHGKIHLRDGDIYELPLMIALLKILSIREPDTTAFSKSDIDFRVQGNHIYLQRIDFNGDAISLLGQGQMDFQQKIDLNFHALVGNDEVRVPVLREVLGGASQQIMQIRVQGTLQSPVTEKVVFPGVNQALQQLQDDLQKGAGSPGLFPQARQRMPHVVGGDSRK